MPDSDLLDRLFGELAGTDLPVPTPASVVARGRQRRRRARGRAAIAVAAVAIVVAGVTQFPRIYERALGTVSQHARLAICAAAPDPQLNAELGSALPASQQQSVSVIALSPNHKVMYLMTTTGGYHGVAAESVATGAISETITTQPPNWNGAQGGLGPHGELVFTMTDSYDGSVAATEVVVWSPTPLPSWMARRNSGQVVPLQMTNDDTDALSAPVFAGPDHQLVAWEASGPGPVVGSDSPTRQIVEADLLTGVTRMVATGYVGAPVFVGSDLVWPVASSATGPTHLVAVSASAFPARQRVRLPLPLRTAGSATAIASSGGATLYASAGLTKLYYSPSVSQPASQVLQLPVGSYLVPGGLAVGAGYLAWNTSAAASYVASAKSLAATRITDGSTSWGGVQSVGSNVLASRSAHPKSGPTSLYLLSGSVIGGLTCVRFAPLDKVG
jgi:hypothetical protein